ncbi:MAG: YetF domain-containing protein [Acutalibacteraceae bacterium]
MFYLSDIQSAIFETNGKISFIPVSTKRPVTPHMTEYQCCKRSPCCQCDYGRAYYAGKSQTYR